VLDGLRHRGRFLGWRGADVGGLPLAAVIVTENDTLGGMSVRRTRLGFG
jgi:hypothetical protein